MNMEVVKQRVLVAAAGLVLSSFAAGCTCGRSGVTPGGGDGGGGGGGRDGGGGFRDVTVSDSGGTMLGDGCVSTGSTGVQRQPATVIFVLDTSGSMLWLVNETSTDPTAQNQYAANAAAYAMQHMSAPVRPDAKWTIFRDSLSQALPGIPADNSLGMFNYPQAAGNFLSCPPTFNVSIGPASQTGTQIVAALNGLTPGGPTPTSSAMHTAFQALQGSTGSNKVVVLATDGAANCLRSCQQCQLAPSQMVQDTADMVAEVRTSNQNGVRTFVIAVPGSGTFITSLQQLATAGGGMLFDLNNAGTASNFSQQLANAFGTISSMTVSCTYAIPSNPSTPFDRFNANVQYTVNGQTTTIPSANGGPNGWRFDNPDAPTQIEIIGTACDAVRANPSTDVRIVFGCPTVLP